MEVKFNVYRKKNGELMLYANNDRRVSVAITQDKGVESPYGKYSTNGKRNLIDKLDDAVASMDACHITGVEPRLHAEEWVKLGDFGYLLLTDVACISGIKVESDGAYLLKDGLLYNLSQWAEVA